MRTEDHRLWQLISPALPVGAFQYSQGLEGAIERCLVSDEPTARDWIGGVLAHVVAEVDLPVLRRVYEAWSRGDEAAVLSWDATARACRETSELRAEDAQMGFAMGELATALDERMPSASLGYVAAFAVRAVNVGLTLDTALHGYAWAWCENQALIAVRALPLGHLEGQRMLRALADRIDPAVEVSGRIEDDAIGRTLPGFAMAGMFHETQYSRVFRS
jgi:urease accessory protein